MGYTTHGRLIRKVAALQPGTCTHQQPCFEDGLHGEKQQGHSKGYVQGYSGGTRGVLGLQLGVRQGCGRE